VAIDKKICRAAPEILWLAGVGDLVAKLTAVADWKLAFNAVGPPVDDFAALLSDATVFSSSPHAARWKACGSWARRYAQRIAMEDCGSSRPAAQRAPDFACAGFLGGKRACTACRSAWPPISSAAPETDSELIGASRENGLLARRGKKDPTAFDWREALRRAPSIKQGLLHVCPPPTAGPSRRAAPHDPHLLTCVGRIAPAHRAGVPVFRYIDI
jgi:glycerol-1-phosphate dehydrogenase [NAD(P)+]